MDSIKRAAKIKGALYIKGLSFAGIDRTHNLPAGTARTTLRDPNKKGEAAIAAALACEPHQLWPERYDASGQRLEPQPQQNYRRPQTMRQRRNERAA